MNKKFRKIGVFLSAFLVASTFTNVVQAKTDGNFSNSNIITSTEDTEDIPKLDTSHVKDGYIKVSYKNSSDKKMKIIVRKDNKAYNYDFYGKGEYENYPLQMGNGSYEITLFENIQGKEYYEVDSWEVEAKVDNIKSTYIISNKIVNWDKSTETINKAKLLTKNIKDDSKKVEFIYNYVVNEIKYDYSKLNTLGAAYVPNIDSVVKDGKGICYDFSSVMAGMLRSVGVPTKLVMGYSNNAKGYHAWNEVYINNKWMIIDATYDSQIKKANSKVNMYKSAVDYKKEKEY